MPADTTSIEGPHALIDEQECLYQMRLFDDGSALAIKVFHAHVFGAARHPLRRVEQIKGWLGFEVSRRTGNYQHRGLGTARDRVTKAGGKSLKTV